MDLHDTKNVSKGKARDFNSCPPKGKIRNVLLAKHGFYRWNTQYHCFQLLFHVCSCIILVSVKIPLKLHHNLEPNVTCENGSSSELGKSYWLRSLGLNTGGPECWGADIGRILGFFSYFLLVRTASVFSGCEEGKERKTCLYCSLCNQEHFFIRNTILLAAIECWWSMHRRLECVQKQQQVKRGIDMQMVARARCRCLARWLSSPSLLNLPRATFHPQTSPVGQPLPVWTRSNFC